MHNHFHGSGLLRLVSVFQCKSTAKVNECYRDVTTARTTLCAVGRGEDKPAGGNAKGLSANLFYPHQRNVPRQLQCARRDASVRNGYPDGARVVKSGTATATRRCGGT